MRSPRNLGERLALRLFAEAARVVGHGGLFGRGGKSRLNHTHQRRMQHAQFRRLSMRRCRRYGKPIGVVWQVPGDRQASDGARRHPVRAGVLIARVSISLPTPLGIRDLFIERVERGREIHVWARPAKCLAYIHCQLGAVRIEATHQRTFKHMLHETNLWG